MTVKTLVEGEHINRLLENHRRLHAMSQSGKPMLYKVTANDFYGVGEVCGLVRVTPYEDSEGYGARCDCVGADGESYISVCVYGCSFSENREVLIDRVGVAIKILDRSMLIAMALS